MVDLPAASVTTFGTGRSLQSLLSGHLPFAAKAAAWMIACGSSQIITRRAVTLASAGLVVSLLSFAHASSQARVPFTTRVVSGVLAPWMIKRLALSNSETLK